MTALPFTATGDDYRRVESYQISERLHAFWKQQYPDLTLIQLLDMLGLSQLDTRDAFKAEGEAPYADHYKGHPFEPVDIAEAYSLNFNEGNIVKYLLRWRKKDGIRDLQKARYYIERLISLEEKRLQEEGK
jgi:hypothetical protein